MYRRRYKYTEGDTSVQMIYECTEGDTNDVTDTDVIHHTRQTRDAQTNTVTKASCANTRYLRTNTHHAAECKSCKGHNDTH